MSTQYVPLHVHSHYSLLDAVIKINDYVEHAKKFNMPAIALTEHGTLSSAIELYNKATQNNIKPILGIEAYLAKRSRYLKENRIVDGYYHITLLVQNEVGWSNLCRLVYESYKPDHFYYKPRIDKELLTQYSEGLICLSGCINGILARSVIIKLGIEDPEYNITEQEKYIAESPESVVSWLKSTFKDRLYIEIQRHGLPYENEINDYLISLAKKHNVPIVATTDTHYLLPEDKIVHNIILTLNSKRDDADAIYEREYTGDYYYLLSPETMNNLFADIPEAVSNTLEIAERCNIKFLFGEYRFPELYGPQEEMNELVRLVKEGLKKRFGDNISKEIIKRVQEELKTIEQMGFAGYFLIVADYIRSQKSIGNLIGPGRGSVAGSLVAYLIGITEVNPLEYGLSFARFLNKGRAAIPEISFPEYPLEQFLENKQRGAI